MLKIVVNVREYADPAQLPGECGRFGCSAALGYNGEAAVSNASRAEDAGMTIQAIYENGVFRPLDAVSLPDQCQVEISIVAAKPASGHPALQRILDVANRYPDNPDAPTDGAAQHDHYLYGTPKRS